MSELLLDKAAGAVGCAHCQKLGAEQACGICHQPVCGSCFDNVASCPDPRPRQFVIAGEDELDVGLSGRYLARRTAWDKPPELYELGTGRPSAEALQVIQFPFEKQRISLLAYPDGDSCIVPGGAERAYGDAHHAHYEANRFSRCDDGRLACFVRADQTVAILDCPAAKVLRSIQEAGEVVQFTALDEKSDLIVLGVYDGAAFFRISDGERLGRLNTGGGDTLWIGVAAGLVGMMGIGDCVLRVGRPAGVGMNYLRLDEIALADQPFHLGHGRHASLSPDGRLLAGAMPNGEVGVLNLQTLDLQVLSLAKEGESTGFFGRLFHMGPHCDFVQFVDGGRKLITASGECVVVWTCDGSRIFAG